MTVTSRPPDGEPSADGDTLIEFLKWILDDHGRAAWALIYTVVVIGAVMAVVWRLDSTASSAIISGLWGGGVGVGGAAAFRGLHRRRRRY